MLFQIFKDMKDIRDKWGVYMTLDFEENMKLDVITIPFIQFIIGDCKYNDLLCGCKGGRWLLINGLYRDYDTIPSDDDTTCVEREHICVSHKRANIIGKTKDELDNYSFVPINNDFNHLSCGGC